MNRKPQPMTPQRLSDLLDTHLPAEVPDLRSFQRWYEPLKSKVIVVATKIHEEVVSSLRAPEEALLAAEGSVRRRAWTVTGSDGASLLKAPESLRTKVARHLFEKGESLPKGRFSLDQLQKLVFGFEDLARFRVVAELPSDAKKVLKILLPERRKGLLGLYPLAGKLKNFVTDLDLRRAGSGHRAMQFSVFGSEGEERIQIEIQIMTRLQDHWDRRNHPLYEWTRQGGNLPPQLAVNDLALAEALHLMDQQAERNWREFLKASRKGLR